MHLRLAICQRNCYRRPAELYAQLS